MLYIVFVFDELIVLFYELVWMSGCIKDIYGMKLSDEDVVVGLDA